MRFPWLKYVGDSQAPLLRIGVRRRGVVIGTDLVVMVDTGADQTLLHLRWADLLGFNDADLVEESCKSASGPMTVYRPKPRSRLGVDFQIGDAWFSVPSLQFGGKVPLSLLGRDMIFEHFDLRMTATDFHLLPRKK